MFKKIFFFSLLTIIINSCTNNTIVGGGGGITQHENYLDEPITNTWVEKYGRLQVKDNKIVDKNGTPVQLRGMSLFWSNDGWGGEKFWNAAVVSNLVRRWNMNIIRAAMGVEKSGGYLENKNSNLQKLKTVVNAAIENGIYVIIDWHAHDIHTSEAFTFFTNIAEIYKTNDNIIFEIFNEPDYETWIDIKNYATNIIKGIRDRQATQLILVGTRQWSQMVDEAADNPITGYSNIAYVLHFYAGTHKQWLRDKALYALNKGIALFVSEWGTCNASGNGGYDPTESTLWINFMNQHKLSWCNWAFNDKNETASALVAGASTTGPWPDSQLTTSGKFVKQHIISNGKP